MRFLKSLIRRLGGNEADGLGYTIVIIIVFLVIAVVGRIAVYSLSQYSFGLWNMIR